MTIEEAYPDCAEAVRHHEAWPAPCWFWFRNAGMDVDAVLSELRHGRCHCFPKEGRAVPARLWGQMGTAGFRRYVAAKLGLM